MGLRERFDAIKKYPEVKEKLEQTQRALAESERKCVELSIYRKRLGEMEHQAEGFSAALAAFCPKASTIDEIRRLYGCVEPYLDPDGFVLYATAKEMTGFKFHEAFPYEDARGQFEEADGHQLMVYLLAHHFGAVDWEIIPGTCYERAVLSDVDMATVEYQAFEKELYERVLRKMGFGDLLTSEPETERERAHAPEKKKGGDPR